jgi:hypothetical protein
LLLLCGLDSFPTAGNIEWQHATVYTHDFVELEGFSFCFVVDFFVVLVLVLVLQKAI